MRTPSQTGAPRGRAYRTRVRFTLSACAALAVAVALACSDALLAPKATAPRAPQTPPSHYTGDPGQASPDQVSGSVSVPEANITPTVSATVGNYPTATIVQYTVTGTHTLKSTAPAPPPSDGYYGLRGRSCQGGDVGTTAFGGSISGVWNACNASISNTETTHSGYTKLAGTVTITHFSDPGSNVAYTNCYYYECFLISGTSSVTITRVDATLGLSSLDVAPQSENLWIVPPGTSVTLGWIVDPVQVTSDGSTLKFGAVVDSKGWEITRPGGKVVGCPYYYISGSYRYCQVKADSALQVSLTALTNGAWKSKTVRVIPRRNFQLDGPTTADRGDTATFTPMMDGQPVPASRWRWVPDDTSSGDVTAGWDGDPKYDHHKEMVTSGTMTAFVDYPSGASDSASLTVGVRDKFTLTASRNSVRFGDSVTFTPLLNDGPTVVARWRWVPADTSSLDTGACPAGTSECVKRMQRSGTMWAWLGGDTTRFATASVAVDTGCVDGAVFDRRVGNNGIRPPSSPWPPVRGAKRRAPGRITPTMICGGGGIGGSDTTTMVTLRVRLDGGISGTPARDTTVRRGTTLAYSYSPNTGFVNPVLAIDDTTRALSGTIALDSDRVLEVAADSDYANQPDIADLRSRLRNLVRSAEPGGNPAEAYRQHILWYDVASEADPNLDRKLKVADWLEFDPVADSLALLQFDSALANYVFEANRVNGVLQVDTVAPGQYSLPVASRNPGTSGQLHLDISPGPAVFEALFVNGINTDYAKARSVVPVLSRILAATSVGDHRAGFFWNRTFGAQVAAMRGLGRCGGKAVRDAGFLTHLGAKLRFYGCVAGMPGGLGILLRENDLSESAQQYLSILSAWAIALPQPEDTRELADFIASAHFVGKNVVLITHSQGNMLASQALGDLRSRGYGLQSPRCTGEISLASPVKADLAFTAYLDWQWIAGATVDGDILWQLGLQTDFLPQTTTDLSIQYEQKRPTFWTIFQDWDWGLKIHDVMDNYFKDVAPGNDELRNRARIINWLNEMYPNCPIS